MDHVAKLLSEHAWRIDVPEYERLGELGAFEGKRVELIRGRIVKRTQIGPLEGWTIQRMNMVLTDYFREVADVRVQLPLWASDDSMPEPDFLLVPKAPEPVGHPKKAYLVIEVAKSSVQFDRVVKAPLYAAGPSPEYWLLNLNTRTLEVNRKPKKGVYTERFELGRDEVISPVAFPKIELPLREFLTKRR